MERKRVNTAGVELNLQTADRIANVKSLEEVSVFKVFSLTIRFILFFKNVTKFNPVHFSISVERGIRFSGSIAFKGRKTGK